MAQSLFSQVPRLSSDAEAGLRGGRLLLHEERFLAVAAERGSVGASEKRAGSIIDLSSLTAADVKHDAGEKPVKDKKIRVGGGPDPDDDPNKKEVDKKGRDKKDKRTDADKRRAAKDANKGGRGGRKNAKDVVGARKEEANAKNDVNKKSGRDEDASRRRANKKAAADRKREEPRREHRGGRRGGGDNSPPGKRPLFGGKAAEEPPADDSDKNPTERGRNKRRRREPPDDGGDDSGGSSGSGGSDSRSRGRRRKYRRVVDVEDDLREIFAEDRFIRCDDLPWSPRALGWNGGPDN